MMAALETGSRAKKAVTQKGEEKFVNCGSGAFTKRKKQQASQ